MNEQQYSEIIGIMIQMELPKVFSDFLLWYLHFVRGTVAVGLYYISESYYR